MFARERPREGTNYIALRRRHQENALEGRAGLLKKL